MTRIFPKTASSQQIQRHYRTLFNYVIDSKQPLVVLNNNKPEVVILDIEVYTEMQKKLTECEQKIAKYAIDHYQKQKEQKNLKILKSLSYLPHEN